MEFPFNNDLHRALLAVLRQTGMHKIQRLIKASITHNPQGLVVDRHDNLVGSGQIGRRQSCVVVNK